MSLQDEIKAAIGKHGMWKARLNQAMETGTSEFKVELVRQDNQCDFGKWLYGPAAVNAARSPQYAKCKDLHAQFHKAAARVLELATTGKKAEAAKAMGPDSDFTRISAELTKAMMEWQRVGA